jgi:uncharacterized membrane protein
LDSTSGNGNGHGSGVDYESTALDRGSYVAAIIHLYRGEISRANAWRHRLDQTTNWAIFGTTAVLGFAFGDTTHSHFAVLFANLVLVMFLFLEARRFRFFDVWRARIRLIETNFFGPILERNLESPEIHWGRLISDDLNQPRFHLTMMQSVRLRLMKNYLGMIGVVTVAWMIKLEIHPFPATDFDEVIDRLRLGDFPMWASVAPIICFYALLLVVVVVCRVRGHRDDWGIGEAIKVTDR